MGKEKVRKTITRQNPGGGGTHEASVWMNGEDTEQSQARQGAASAAATLTSTPAIPAEDSFANRLAAKRASGEMGFQGQHEMCQTATTAIHAGDTSHEHVEALQMIAADWFDADLTRTEADPSAMTIETFDGDLFLVADVEPDAIGLQPTVRFPKPGRIKSSPEFGMRNLERDRERLEMRYIDDDILYECPIVDHVEEMQEAGNSISILGWDAAGQKALIQTPTAIGIADRLTVSGFGRHETTRSLWDQDSSLREEIQSRFDRH